MELTGRIQEDESMGVNTTGLLNTQTEVYASYKNDAVTKNETAAKKDSTAKTEEKMRAV